MALGAAAIALALTATAYAQAGGGEATISYKFMASCIPNPDLSVSDCHILDIDVAKDDTIMHRALRYISAARLHPNWRSTLKMDGQRVIIPFTMRIHRPD
ncbi:MAG: hypothetical protein ACREEW_18230 [Caulobacteraceae bacterium]